MPAVGDPLFQYQLHELLRRRGHVLEALTEGHDGKAHALQILDHLDRAPAVEGDLPDVEFFAQTLDELFDIAVVGKVCSFRLLTLSIT